MKQYIIPMADIILISVESIIMNTSGENIHWEAPRRCLWEDDPEEQFLF